MLHVEHSGKIPVKTSRCVKCGKEFEPVVRRLAGGNQPPRKSRSRVCPECHRPRLGRCIKCHNEFVTRGRWVTKANGARKKVFSSVCSECEKTQPRRCRKCKNEFVARVRWVRRNNGKKRKVCSRVCPKCRRRRANYLRRLTKARHRKRRLLQAAKEPAKTKRRKYDPLERHARLRGLTRLEVGQALGLAEHEVRAIEKQALQKLRNAPQVRRALRLYQADGCPGLSDLLADILVGPAGRGEALLALQADLIDWWETVERLRSQGMTEGLDEVVKELGKCQRLLAEQVRKL
jgi:hypothetical protein